MLILVFLMALPRYLWPLVPAARCHHAARIGTSVRPISAQAYAIGWALRRATRVIALSRQLAALAEGLGVDATRIEVIENGVDIERFKPTDTADARRRGGCRR